MINGVATAQEMAYLRTPGQWSRLRLAILPQPVVWKARVNQSFTSADAVTTVTYDTVTYGSYTDLVSGMTVLVGTQDGAGDVGRVRLRSATASILTIGRVSEVAWADNLYLTAILDFDVWIRYAKIVGESIYMDDDVSYTDQHKYPSPVPVLGPDAVVELVGDDVSTAFDAAASWCPGSTVTGYAWSAPGAAATSGMTTATPTITYNAAGVYRVSCTVTAANARSATGHRMVYVWDITHPLISDFEIERLGYQSGGYAFSVRLHGDASSVTDGARAILVAEDFFGSTPISLGPIVGRENIVAWGRIAGETIQIDVDRSMASFEVRGPAQWMGLLDSPVVGVRNSVADAASWGDFKDLTADAYLWHLITWRSTAAIVMDVIPSGDTRVTAALEAQTGSLWQQISAPLYSRFVFTALCDRYGRLRLRAENQVTPVADRQDAVMSLIATDCRERIDIREQLPAVSLIEQGAFAYANDEFVPLLSRAPGNVGRRMGRRDAVESLVVTGQAQLNTICGLRYAWLNMRYPSISLQLNANNRLLEIGDVIELTLSAADTAQRLVWTAQRLVVREISYERRQSGALLTNLACEIETSGPDGITVPSSTTLQRNTTAIERFDPTPNKYIMPNFPNDPPDWFGDSGWGSGGSWPGGWGGSGNGGGLLDGDGGQCAGSADAPANGPFRIWLGRALYSNQRQPLLGQGIATVRASTATNRTSFTLTMAVYENVGTGSENVWQATDDVCYTVYLRDWYGDRIATGVIDSVSGGEVKTIDGHFSPPAAAKFYYVEIAFNDPDVFEVDQIEYWEPIPGGSIWSPADPPVDLDFYATPTGVSVYVNQTSPNVKSTTYPGYGGPGGLLYITPPSGVSYVDKYFAVQAAARSVMTPQNAGWEAIVRMDIVHGVNELSNRVLLKKYYAYDDHEFDVSESIDLISKNDFGSNFIKIVTFPTFWSVDGTQVSHTANFNISMRPSYKLVAQALHLWNICP